ncbi:MAG: hypothetical protein JJU00_12030 [Opitutales bacterium]|nr:hypothetical protein [Opitutales bacterium]
MKRTLKFAKRFAVKCSLAALALTLFPPALAYSQLTEYPFGARGAAFLDTWSWAHPVSDGEPAYNDLIEANGNVIAVGDGGRITVSVDGNEWASPVFPTAEDLYGVTFGSSEGAFYAVGDAGTVLRSTDMETWDVVPPNGDLTVDIDLRGIAYLGGGAYAAVGLNGVILHSTDGTTWMDVSVSGFTVDLAAVASVSPGDPYVAVGSAGTILSSENGTDWDIVQTGLEFDLNAVYAPQGGMYGWQYFAVGDSGIILSSVDGTSWSTRFSETTYALTGIQSGNGLLVAVGDSGRLVMSRDGELWFETLTRFPVNLKAVVFNQDEFYAAGENHTIFQGLSVDGSWWPDSITWTVRETTSSITLHSAANGNGLRVAVGDDGLILTSSDGAAWSPVEGLPTSDEDLFGVTFADGLFIAVGQEGTILRSIDGENWSFAASVPTVNTLNDVHWSDGQFVAVGDNFTILTSADGDNWSLRTTGTGQNLVSVAHGNDVWVAVGDQGLVLTSEHGTSWRSRFSNTQSDLKGVSFGSGKFVAVGSGGTVLTSTFASSWTYRVSGTTSDLHSSVFVDGVFLAVGKDFTFATSLNGIDWSAQESGIGNSLNHIDYMDGLFVAVGEFESILTASSVLPPGLDRWLIRSPLPSGPALEEVIYADGKYVAVGDEGVLLVSTDGRNWNIKDTGVQDSITGVAYGNGRFVAVGGQNLLVSPDAITWTVQETWIVPIYKVAFGNDRFVAVGASSHIITSQDGIIWAGGQVNADGQQLHDVRYEADRNRFIVVGAPAEMTTVFNTRELVPQDPLIDPDIVFSYPETSVTQIYTSANGINWERVQPPLTVTPTRLIPTQDGVAPDPLPEWLSRTLKTVSYGNDYFLAAGEGVELIGIDVPAFDDPFGQAREAGQGRSWRIQALGGVTVNGSVFGDGRGNPRFVLVGENGAVFARDPAGISFPGIIENLNSVTYGAGQYVAVGDNSRILTSPDGQFWQLRSQSVLDSFNAITSIPGQYVVVGDMGRVFVSGNAVDWEEATTPTQLGLRAIARSGSRYIAVGDAGMILTSPDGSTWQQRVSGTLSTLNSIARSPTGVVVAVGANGEVIRSNDSSIGSWTIVESGILAELHEVIFSDLLDIFIAVGESGTVLTSDDLGATWNLSTDFGGMPLYAVSESEEVLVAVGEGGRIFTSEDGILWEARFSGTSNALNAVSYGDGIFLATGAEGIALSSTDDGRTWFRRHANTGYALNGIDFRNGFFTAVGSFSTIITSGDTESKFDQTIQFAPISEKTIADGSFALSAQSTSGLPVSFEIVSGPATVDENIVTLTGEAGNVVIRAIQPGNANFRPAPPVEQSFRVTVATQEITFAPLENIVFGSGPVTLEATSDSGLPVRFEVESGPAALSGNTLSINGTGTVTVVARQDGDEEFSEAVPVARSFEVLPAPQTITFQQPGEYTLGDPPVPLIASASSGLPVEFRVASGPGVIDGTNLVIDGTGVILVEARQPGSDLYEPAVTVVREVVVGPASTGNFWTAIPAPVQSDLFDVIFAGTGAEPRFVAVGSQQTVVSSGTGTGWSLRSFGSANLTSIVFGNNSFLASGLEGTRLRSSDGLDWNPLSAPLVASVNSMAYGRGLYVVAGQNGFIATSPDGSDWTTRDSGTPNSLFSVIYSEGEFLAAGDGIILRSEDGRNWTPVFTAQGDGFRGLARNGDRIVVVGESSIVWSSVDNGGTWSLGLGVMGNLNAVAHGAGRFVAVGEDGVIFTSADGREWTPRASNTEVTLRSIAYTHNVFVVVGDGGTILTTAESSTEVSAKTAQSISFAALPDVSYDTGSVSLSASAESGLPVRFGVSSGPAVLESDGATLTLTGVGELVVRASQPGDSTYAPAAEVERRFTVSPGANAIDFPALADAAFGDAPVALAASASSSLPVSFELVSGPAELDGDVLTLTGAGEVTVRALQGGDAFHAAAAPVERSFTVARAAQTISFDVPAAVTLGSAPLELEASASSGLPVSLALVSGPGELDGGVLTITGSGSVVVEASQSGDADWAAAAAVTRTITVTSVDVGEFWRVLGVPSSADLEDVIHANGRFVAVGAGQTVLESADGETWTGRSSGSVDLGAVAFGNNRFLAAGDAGTRLVSSSGTSWSPLSGPLNEAVRSLAYGQGLYAAVGVNGGLLTSPDGVGWTARETGTADDLRAVTYFDGVFYAVGGGSVLRSRDGRGWTLALFSAQDDLRGVTVRPDDGRIVVVGADSTVWHSDDGETWTLGDVIEADLNTVSSGAGVFLAAGENGALYRSADGQSWNAVASGTSASLRGSAFVENMFVIVGENGVVLTSAEAGQSPESKTAQSISFAALPDVSYDTGSVSLSASAESGLPVRFGVSSGPAVLESDGATLTLTGVGEVVVRASQPGDSTYAPAAEVERRFTVLGRSQTITFGPIQDKVFGGSDFFLTATATSGLPVSFELISGPVELDGDRVSITAAGVVIIRAVQEGNDIYSPAAPVEQSFTVARASQTITFDTVATMEENDPPAQLEASSTSGLPVEFAVLSGPGRVVEGSRLEAEGVGTIVVEASQPGDDNYSAAVSVSREVVVLPAGPASEWLPAVSGTAADLFGVGFAGHRFYAVGTDLRILEGSRSGETWTARTSGSSTLRGIASGAGRYVAVGDSGVALRSDDGVSWQLAGSGANVPLNDVVYANGRFVAVGAGGTVYTSPDGVVWSSGVSGVSQNLLGVAYGGGRFVAVGGNVILTSFDGASWTVFESGLPVTLRSVAYGNNRFVVIGEDFTTWTSTDGSSWFVGHRGGPEMFGVAYGVDRFIAVGAEGSVFTSVDGASWIARSAGVDVTLRDVAFADEQFVIVGDGGTILVSGTLLVKSPQVIDFPAIPDRAYTDGPLILEATASSGLPVSFAVVSGPAVIQSDRRTLAFSGAGEVTVRAIQGGNINYEPATQVTRTFQVRGQADDGDFVAQTFRDLLYREATTAEVSTWKTYLRHRSRAEFVESLLKDSEYTHIRWALMARSLMTGNWGGPVSLIDNTEILDEFSLRFLMETLLPDFEEAFLGGFTVPQSTSARREVDEFLRAVWFGKYGVSHEPTAKQLDAWRERFLQVPVDVFLAMVLQDVTGFDGGSVVLGVPNVPDDLLRNQSYAAGLLVGLLRIQPHDQEVVRLAELSVLEQIESVLSDSRYLDRFFGPLQGEIEYEDDLRYSSWLGWYSVDRSGWTYTSKIGWTWMPSGSTAGVWMFHANDGWVWTTPGLFSSRPIFYHSQSGSWSHLERGENGRMEFKAF